MTELPRGWTRFTLSEIGGTVGGKTPTKSISHYWDPPEIPWASPKDMKVFLLKTTEDRIARAAITDYGMNILPPGSVLMVTRSGILSHTFPVAIAEVPITINQDVKAVLPNDLVTPRYLAYMLRAYEREILHSCSKEGTTVASVETHLLEQFELPLAPPHEQKLISDRLDAVFARLNACHEHIERLPAIIEVARKATLSAAARGMLTRA
jgi:type I restriction enzyme, S subunit